MSERSAPVGYLPIEGHRVVVHLSDGWFVGAVEALAIEVHARTIRELVEAARRELHAMGAA